MVESIFQIWTHLWRPLGPQDIQKMLKCPGRTPFKNARMIFKGLNLGSSPDNYGSCHLPPDKNIW